MTKPVFYSYRIAARGTYSHSHKELSSVVDKETCIEALIVYYFLLACIVLSCLTAIAHLVALLTAN